LPYREKISGARADRPQLGKLMASLKRGDVVVVTAETKASKQPLKSSRSMLPPSRLYTAWVKGCRGRRNEQCPLFTLKRIRCRKVGT
jgi:hypothetical protein